MKWNGRDPVDVVARLDPYGDSYQARQAREREQVGRAVEDAVAQAIAGAGDAKVVVINLTVQYASGGGATNIVGDDPRPNRRTS